ncbi:MAG: 30S ribosomal protein S20 [Clostridiaceae bacterium]|nr:30S ribosomal protein S20 [Clostridiaceae bacterium]
MPNIKSSIKRVRKARAKTAQNKARRSELKTVIRNFNKALVSNSENKEELLKIAIKKLDKAASKKLIHKNKASRKKSQLMKAYNAAAVQAAE